MKKIRLLLVALFLAVVTFNTGWGQTLHAGALVSVYGINYGPGIGEVWGTYTYQFLIKLNDDGYIKSIHWSIGDCNLYNTDGDKVNIVGGGNSTNGILWEFLNRPNASNYPYPITYSVSDGWLDVIMPESFPEEGHYVNMGCKLVCKGTQFRLSGLVQIHMNAHGEITATVIK